MNWMRRLLPPVDRVYKFKRKLNEFGYYMEVVLTQIIGPLNHYKLLLWYVITLLLCYVITLLLFRLWRLR